MVVVEGFGVGTNLDRDLGESLSEEVIFELRSEVWESKKKSLGNVLSRGERKYSGPWDSNEFDMLEELKEDQCGWSTIGRMVQDVFWEAGRSWIM